MPRRSKTKNKGASAADSQTKSILLGARAPQHFFRSPKGPPVREEGLIVPVIQSIFRSICEAGRRRGRRRRRRRRRRRTTRDIIFLRSRGSSRHFSY